MSGGSAMECLNTHYLLQIPSSSLLAATVSFSNQDKLKVFCLWFFWFIFFFEKQIKYPSLGIKGVFLYRLFS